MNEQEQISQLSALFDNELPPEQADLVIRRAMKDPAMRASWTRYALIGACLRNEPIHSNARQPDVAERVRMALAGEAEHPVQSAPALVGAARGRRDWSVFGKGALGGAIAAGVAMVGFYLVRSVDTEMVMPAPAVQIAQASDAGAVFPDAQPAQVVAQFDAAAAADDPAPSITTPIDDSPRQRVSGPLARLVAAHSEVAASAMRVVPLSVVVGGNYDVTQGFVDMTEAEIGAYR